MFQFFWKLKRKIIKIILKITKVKTNQHFKQSYLIVKICKIGCNASDYAN